MLDIKKRLEELERQRLSPFACLSETARRRRPETRQGHRTDFAVDADRILHSRAYTRYIDKTQVFYLVNNDHITHRVLHVQLVSKIARTIGRVFALNEDLIEAIALGHDIGHPPFGHDGEAILHELAVQHGLESFQHNLQSVRLLEKIEQQGRGCNLTVQVLDGILCHDGEIHNRTLAPQGPVSFDHFDEKYRAKTVNRHTPLLPMTMEGCVVRLADTISYIGRDIEDAIELGLIQRDHIPARCQQVLGRTNGTIVYSLVADLLAGGCEGEIGFSEEVSAALVELKRFNYQHIYLNTALKPDADQVRHCFQTMFTAYLGQLESRDTDAAIYQKFMSFRLKSDVDYALFVIDYIAGMTDDFFLAEGAKLGCDIRGLSSRNDRPSLKKGNESR